MKRQIDYSDPLLPTLKADVVHEILCSGVSGERAQVMVDQILFAPGWTAHHVAHRIREQLAAGEAA